MLIAWLRAQSLDVLLLDSVELIDKFIAKEA